jgi:SAM-dependent methyltransferase
LIKLNLGCGTNRLDGWRNHDSDMPIHEPLRFGAGTVDYVFAEHVVEHVYYEQAIGFFRECVRVLRPGGTARIAVPSVEQIWRTATAEYCEFTRRWVTPRDETVDGQLRGALENILFKHGHRAPWTEGLLLTTLFYAGFGHVKAFAPGQSDDPELRGIEGHGKVIGDKFNCIETVVAEATKGER